MNIHGSGKGAIGRPRKFRGPRRPVTVTLPETTLARLAAIDEDRARAIVKVTDMALATSGKDVKQVEVVEVTSGLGIILVGPCQSLQKIKGLRLVEVAPMRFLVVIPTGTTIDAVELAITDLLDDTRHEALEHSTLVQLRDLIRNLRRQSLFSKAEILFVDTRTLESESPRVARRNSRRQSEMDSANHALLRST
jgi:hypothetical protein